MAKFSWDVEHANGTNIFCSRNSIATTAIWCLGITWITTRIFPRTLSAPRMRRGKSCTKSMRSTTCSGIFGKSRSIGHGGRCMCMATVARMSWTQVAATAAMDTAVTATAEHMATAVAMPAEATVADAADNYPDFDTSNALG